MNISGIRPYAGFYDYNSIKAGRAAQPADRRSAADDLFAAAKRASGNGYGSTG